MMRRSRGVTEAGGSASLSRAGPGGYADHGAASCGDDTAGYDRVECCACPARCCGTDTEANLRRGLDACRSASGLGADTVLFPELWQIAYTDYPADPGRAQRLGRPHDRPGDAWLRDFRDLTCQAGIARS
jgi:hypothetical protein